MTTILKLGGSLITEKDERETVDMDALADAASALGEATDEISEAADEIGDLVVVHGGGSFGHHHAEKHGVSRTAGTDDPAAVRDIHDAMGRLNKAVLDYLNDAGVSAVPIRPFSAGYRDTDDELSLATTQVDAMLDEGFVPVLHGDVITHAGKGATIVSGDELVTALARNLEADRVGLCSTVPGVLDEAGDVIPEIDAYEDVAAVLGGSESTDVTGGMAAKVQELLALDAPAVIFGPDDLRRFLAGDAVGTRVDGSA